MHANRWILDRFLITYGPICKFVAEVAYFVDLRVAFLLPGSFLTLQLSTIKPVLEKAGKAVMYLGHNTPLWCPAPLSEGGFTPSEQPPRDLNISQPQFAQVVSFKAKISPLVFSAKHL